MQILSYFFTKKVWVSCVIRINVVPLQHISNLRMILLADSGSTKVHWLLSTQSGQQSDFFTDGINPVMQPEETVRHIISDQLLPQIAKHLWIGPVTRIDFYGAGCTPEKKVVVAEVLASIFRHADIRVESDMLGAARGLFGNRQGVACILGTGSGSCFYDGEKIAFAVPSLGFILGDEGSAATLGKRLVGDIFKNQLGDDLKQRFLEQYRLTQADVIERVYRQPLPNRFLANLARFCAENIADERIHRLVYEHFESFVTRNLLQYMPAQGTMPVGFVGSVAYYYKEVLTEVLTAHRMTISAILKDPIEGLANQLKQEKNY